MRVAFVTDVHGNLPALEAVLADARLQGVDEVWDGGDTVGYHPWPAACVRLLHESCSRTVAGNYDLKVLKAPRRRKRWLRRKDATKARALIWAWDHLDPETRELLAARPRRQRVKTPSGVVLMCHGSPLSIKEPLGPATSRGRWQQLVTAADGAALVVHGHTHVMHGHREGGTVFVNPGSVGRAQDGDPRAAYALLDLGGKRPQVLFRRIPYDVQRVVDEIGARRLPPEFAIMVQRGINLARARRALH